MTVQEFYNNHCPARQTAQCNNKSMPCKYLTDRKCTHKDFPNSDRKPLGMK